MAFSPNLVHVARDMRICIIGAGGAGLAAGRHTLEHGFEFDVFEQSGQVGGTWVYTDNVDTDDNGLPVHSSMYQNLRTNLPKETMFFEDYPYPEQKTSFVYQPEVAEYLQDFAKKSKIMPYIKFYHHVTKVEPLDDNKWLVQVSDIKSKIIKTLVYDAVIVCNGHYSTPNMSKITGIETFTGRCKHSHQYRTPAEYKDRTVLVIGAGPSGSDISNQMISVARKVFISHKLDDPQFPLQAIQKPGVVEIKGDLILFEDRSAEKVDDILLCTGYLFTFPFLTEKCGLKVDDNYVFPLYKHVINVEHPTMGVVGVSTKILPFPAFDIQARFFLSTLNGHFTLPSKEEMLREIAMMEKTKTEEGIFKRHFCKVGVNQMEYFDDLAMTADIRKIPHVISKIFLRVNQNRNLDACFKIIDDENFVELE